MLSIFEKHPKVTITIIIFVLFGIMDFTLSIVYNKISEYRERTGLGIEHPVYHHDFIKNGVSHETGRLGNYTIYTNSLGFKDKSNRKIERKSDHRRIVFIGDSFTEGILLNYEDTFVGIIDSTVSNQNIEVLNAGRVSYSPIIYWRKIKYLIEKQKLEFDELVVFVDISDMDDEASYYDLSKNNTVVYQPKYRKENKLEERDYGIPWISNKSISETKRFLRKNFIVAAFFVNKIHDLLFDDTLELYEESNSEKQNQSDSLRKERNYNSWDYILTDYRSNWTFDDKFYNDFGERGKKRMIKYMDRLKNLCDENDIKLTVVIYPWPSQIWYEDLNSRHVKIWQDWTDKNKVKFINLFPSFIKLNASDTEKVNIMNKYYVPYDLHMNRKGNELIAKEFIKYYF